MLSMLDILTGRNPHPLPEVEKRDPFRMVRHEQVQKQTTWEIKKQNRKENRPPNCICPMCKFNSKVIGPQGRMYAYCRECAVIAARRHDDKRMRERLAYGPVKPERYVNPTCKCCGERMKRYKTQLMCPNKRPPTMRELRAQRQLVQQAKIINERVGNVF